MSWRSYALFVCSVAITASAARGQKAIAATGTATFVKDDATTAGSWKGIYGADGLNVINNTAGYPSYVRVTPSGNSLYTWASSTTDGRALQKASSTTDRIAACWYSSSSFRVDLKFNDTNVHQVALYVLDWDKRGRTETVNISDANNHMLDSESVTKFSGGQYLIWNLSGHVIVQITNTASPNAVLSGLFFAAAGLPAIESTTSAVGTAGSAFWYQITASNAPTSYAAAGLPAGLAVNTGTGLISGTPTSAGTSTVTLSATNSGGTGNATLTLTIAAAAPVISSAITANGAAGSAFSYQITASNAPTSYAAVGLPAGVSVNTGTGLISGTPTAAGTSTVTLSATNSGGTGNAPLTLTIAPAPPVISSGATASGTVGSAFSYQITASNAPTSYAAAGLPAGVSVNTGTGLISGTPTAAGTSTVTLGATNSGGTGNATLTLTIAAAPPGAATFVKADTTTEGSWIGVYGADGSNVITYAVNYPSYVTVTPSANSLHTWASSSTDVRALQKASSTTDRLAACWYSRTSFTVDLNFNDTHTHQVALYLLDWDQQGRTETVNIVDANNYLLDSRSVTGFSAGQYLVWNLSGHVIVQITNTGSLNGVLSGLFFGPTGALTIAPSSINFGNVALGNDSTQSVVLNNTSASSITISQANIAGKEFSVSGLSLPLVLGAGQNSTFSVAFTPPNPGTVGGSLSLVSTATNSPTTEALSGTGTHAMDLTWQASTSVVVGYDIYRATVSGGPYTELNSSSVPGTTYADSTVQAGQRYYYVVTAVDSNNDQSAYSNEASALVPTP